MGDDALVARAAAGDVEAFEELYRRHHVLARRLAQKITGDEDDARDAAAEAFTRVFGVVSSRGLRQHSSFRSYLLTTVRHVGIDKVRQRRRVESTDDITPLDAVSLAQGPADAALTSEDGRLLLEAFRQLPERSRSVLWLVDVERVPTRAAAKALGLTPNNVAQIAVRARTRLRHSYLQAHLAGTVESGCRFTVEHLASFIEGALCTASVTKLEAHLRECGSCRSRVEQLRDLGVATRRALLPVLLLQRVTGVFRRSRRQRPFETAVPSAELAGAAPHTLQLGSQAVAVVSNPAAVDVLQTLGQSPAVHRLVACVAAGTMAVGASSVAFKSAPTGPAAAAAAVTAAGPAVTAGETGPMAAQAVPGVAGTAAVPGGQPAAVTSPTRPSPAGAGSVVGAPQTGLAAARPVGGLVAASGGPGTVQSPAVGAGNTASATGSARAPGPVALGAPPPTTVLAAAGQSQALGTPPPTTVLAAAGQSQALGTPPPTTVSAAAAAGDQSRPPAGPTLTVGPVSAPAVPAPQPVAQGSTSGPSTGAPAIPSPSIPASPVTTAPATVARVSAAADSVPASVPVSVPVSVPASTASVSVPSPSVPVSVLPSTPPLSAPSVSVPVSAPAVSAPEQLTTPAVSVPASTSGVTVPPVTVVPATAVSVPTSTPPTSVAVAGPPLPVPEVSAGPVSVTPAPAKPLGAPPLATPLSNATAGILP